MFLDDRSTTVHAITAVSPYDFPIYGYLTIYVHCLASVSNSALLLRSHLLARSLTVSVAYSTAVMTDVTSCQELLHMVEEEKYGFLSLKQTTSFNV
jgi:hypothetical protein